MNKLIGFSGATVLYALLNVVSVAMLTRIFPPTEYGTANLAISIATILATVMYIASDHPLMRYYYTHSLSSILKNTIKIEIITLSLILTGLILINFFIINIDFLFLLVIVIYAIGLNIGRVTTTLFRMEQRVSPYSFALIGQKLLQLFIIFCFSFITQNFYLILLSFIASSIIVPFTILTKYIREFSFEGEVLSFREHISYSAPHMIAALNTSLTQNIDKFILSAFVSPFILGIYYAAFRVIGVVNIFYRIFTLMWVPKTIKLYDENRREYEIWMHISKILVSIGCIVLGSIILFSRDIIVLLLGQEYEQASQLLILLMFVPLFHINSEVYAIKFNLVKKPRYHVYISTVLLLVTSISSILLVPQMGVDGAVLAIAVSYLFYFLLRFFIAQNITGDFNYYIFIPLTNTIFFFVALYIYFNGLSILPLSVLLIILIVYIKPGIDVYNSYNLYFRS